MRPLVLPCSHLQSPASPSRLVTQPSNQSNKLGEPENSKDEKEALGEPQMKSFSKNKAVSQLLPLPGSLVFFSIFDPLENSVRQPQSLLLHRTSSASFVSSDQVPLGLPCHFKVPWPRLVLREDRKRPCSLGLQLPGHFGGYEPRRLPGTRPAQGDMSRRAGQVSQASAVTSFPGAAATPARGGPDTLISRQVREGGEPRGILTA